MRLRLVIVAFLLLPTVSLGEAVDYLRDVQPLLARHCYGCHGPAKQKAGLRLDSPAALRNNAGNDLVVPGKSNQSLLYLVLRGGDELTRMPYRKPPLPEDAIARIRDWIDQGAPLPQSDQVRHWAFVPPVRPAVPKIASNWPKNPIDCFILARLQREGLSPSAEADRYTLIRRISLDLTGLLPDPSEAEAFATDRHADAYDRLVDRLLGSPHFGERWARHWLDLARYGDSQGYSIDGPRQIWKYRDWVIDAFNRNMPFDQFVVEQLAGDMLPNASVDQRIATGFHRNTPINQEGGIDKEQFRIEAVYDRVNTTGTVFLGLTLACARCHDHKYDPISQREYFRIFAVFNNADEPTLQLASATVAAKRAKLSNQIRAKETELNRYLVAKVDALSDEARNGIDRKVIAVLNLRLDQRTAKQKQLLIDAFKDDETVQRLGKEIASLRKQLPRFPTTMVMRERSKPRQTRIHIQGDFTRPGEPVEPGVPAVLHRLTKRHRTSDRLDRLGFARWLVDRNNPLLARVTVNRIWQRFFGRGLVETENDFGTQGARPTHPDLLDWLAVEFMDSGWNVKHIHRLIVTSATYRQQSHRRQERSDKDPANRLLSRQNRLRLEAEIIRDVALSASGLLARKLGGPSVFPPQPKGVYRFTQVPKAWKPSRGTDRFRRGMYTWLWRSALHPALTVFDAPDAVNCCTRRNQSNTPLQALTLLNDPDFTELAYGLANRLVREGPPSPPDRIAFAFRLCLTRKPDELERNRLLQFYHDQLTKYRNDPDSARRLIEAMPESLAHLRKADTDAAEFAAWLAIARVLMNLDEFITRE